MLAGLAFLNLFIEHYQVVVPAGKIIHLYSDNIALVTWIQRLLQGLTYPRMCLKSEADVILQIQHEIHQCHPQLLQLNIEHVYGHQDKVTPYHALPREAQLNVDADSFATNYLLHGTQSVYSEFPQNPVNLYLNQGIVTRNHKRIIRKAALSPDIRDYMIKKYHWTSTVPNSIWWQIHGSTINKFPTNDRRRLRKYIFQWLPTSQREHRQNDAVSDKCPSCNCIEDHQHLLRCYTTSRATIKDQAYSKLDTFLSNEKHTPP
jgi:hypothetical protein